MALDLVDRKLLNLLQKNAKLTTRELADELHLTTTPVFERIKRLEREGYIRQYVALLDRQQIKQGLIAYCNVSLKEHALGILSEFEQMVQELPMVLEVLHTTGQYDYLLKVVVPDMDAYHEFITQQLATIKNIGQVHSIFVLNEIKQTTVLPV